MTTLNDLDTFLRSWGLTDRPDLQDDTIHGTDCKHPDRYGACDCFEIFTYQLCDFIDTHTSNKRIPHLEGIIRNTLTMHAPMNLDDTGDVCSECSRFDHGAWTDTVPWPCRTVKALKGQP